MKSTCLLVALLYKLENNLFSRLHSNIFPFKHRRANTLPFFGCRLDPKNNSFHTQQLLIPKTRKNIKESLASKPEKYFSYDLIILQQRLGCIAHKNQAES